MKVIDKIYVNGEFITPHGTEIFDLISPVTNQLIGQVRLGDEEDTRLAIKSAQAAFVSFSKTTREERISYLQRLHDAIAKRSDELAKAMIEEFGGPGQFCAMVGEYAAKIFLLTIETLKKFEFIRTAGSSRVVMEPLGVAGLITPWNISNAFICSKLASAISAGCPVVIKPSEMSAIQTQILVECLHEAGLPAGVINVVNGRGEVVGAEIASNPGISKISFTGSTVVGKMIARIAADTMKRLTLELGGKSPNIILDDADFEKAIPMAISSAFMNSGQACLAGTRLLVPEDRLEEVKELVKATVGQVKVGNPAEEGTAIGPMVSKKQYDRVQEYIKKGIEEGAEVLIGGAGHPEGLEAGNFVKPTVFTGVTNDMLIAREEIFGPVLCVLTYRTEEEAIAIANDTLYGLQAYISSSDLERAHRVADRITAGQVLINGLENDLFAPFGGFKQSGIGREFGTYGLEAFLEPKSIR